MGGGKTIKYAWGVIENYMEFFNAEEIKFYDAVFLWWRLWRTTKVMINIRGMNGKWMETLVIANKNMNKIYL